MIRRLENKKEEICQKTLMVDGGEEVAVTRVHTFEKEEREKDWYLTK